jgi:DNA-binding MarR family transcriptional regulator
VRQYGPLLAEIDLTYPQYLVLLVLWAWDREQHPRPTVTALGARLDLDSGTLTPLLRRLEQKGLLTRERASGDERELLVRVTRSGRALKRRARKIPLSLLKRSTIPVSELIELRERLNALRSSLGPEQQA